MCANYESCGGCSCFQSAPCTHCLDNHDGSFNDFGEVYNFGDIRDEIPDFKVVPVGPNKDIQLSKYWGLCFERGLAKIVLPVMFLSKVTKAMAFEGGLAQLSDGQIGHLEQFYNPRPVKEGKHEWKRFAGGKSNLQQKPRETPVDPDGAPTGYFLSDYHSALGEMLRRENWKDSRGFAVSRAIGRVDSRDRYLTSLRPGNDTLADL